MSNRLEELAVEVYGSTVTVNKSEIKNKGGVQSKHYDDNTSIVFTDHTKDWKKANPNKSKSYNIHALKYTVKKGENLRDHIIPKVYKPFDLDLTEEVVNELINLILIANKLPNATLLQTGDTILLPNPGIRTKKEGDFMYAGQFRVNFEGKEHIFPATGVYSETLMGSSSKYVRNYLWSLSAKDWRRVIKSGKLDTPSEFRFWGQANFLASVSSGRGHKAKSGKDTGWLVHRWPNVFEVVSLLKALVYKDVDLVNWFHEGSWGPAMADKIHKDRIAQFIEENMHLLVELEAYKYRHSMKSNRKLYFEPDAIKALAYEGGFRGGNSIQHALVKVGYQSISLGIYNVIAGDKNQIAKVSSKKEKDALEEKYNAGLIMIGIGMRILRTTWETVEENLKQQASVVESMISSITLPLPAPIGYVSEVFKEFYKGKISEWIVTGGSVKSSKEKIRKMKLKVNEDLRYLVEKKKVLSTYSRSDILSEMGFID